MGLGHGEGRRGVSTASAGAPSLAWAGTCPEATAIRPWTLLEGKRDRFLHGFGHNSLRGAFTAFPGVSAELSA